MMKLNCITVDDEPLALNLINVFVGQTPFLNLSGSYANGIEALEAIHNKPIDLIILDIQMPHLDGMELARLLTSSTNRSDAKIIFTTAFNQFALEAYKVHALDYLLKPFGYDEFLRAAQKVKSYFELIDSARNQPEPVEENCIFVKADYKLVRVELDSILFLESVKDAVKIHLTAPMQPVFTSVSLKSIEEKLPRTRFLRIHRSFIIATSRIDSVSKNSIYVGKSEIPVGDLYRSSFDELTGNWA